MRANLKKGMDMCLIYPFLQGYTWGFIAVQVAQNNATSTQKYKAAVF